MEVMTFFWRGWYICIHHLCRSFRDTIIYNLEEVPVIYLSCLMDILIDVGVAWRGGRCCWKWYSSVSVRSKILCRCFHYSVMMQLCQWYKYMTCLFCSLFWEAMEERADAVGCRERERAWKYYMQMAVEGITSTTFYDDMRGLLGDTAVENGRLLLRKEERIERCAVPGEGYSDVCYMKWWLTERRKWEVRREREWRYREEVLPLPWILNYEVIRYHSPSDILSGLLECPVYYWYYIFRKWDDWWYQKPFREDLMKKRGSVPMKTVFWERPNAVTLEKRCGIQYCYEVYSVLWRLFFMMEEG